MIYDTFLFFDELDLLDARLHELHEVVDKFVLVESTRTQSNLPKPLHFAANKERFARFADKIVHIVVEDSPDTDVYWDIERFQRDCIQRGLKDCRPDDIVLMSDLDEIPRAEKVSQVVGGMRFKAGALANWWHTTLKSRFVVRAMRRRWKKHHPFVRVFEHRHYTYYLNWLCEDVRWAGTRVVFFRDWGAGRDLRRWGGARVRDGGWHFTWMGDVKGILRKLEATVHQELHTTQNRDAQRLQQLLDATEKGRTINLFGRTATFRRVEIDDTFPAFIRDNPQLFRKWIKNPTPMETAEKAPA